MAPLLIFLGLTTLGMAAMIALTIYRTGSIVGMIDYYARSGALTHFVIVFVLAMAGAMLSKASASTFEYTEIYAGLESPIIGASVQCTPGSGPDDQWTSNLGVAQHLWSPHRDVDLLAQWTHHSCAIGDDRNVSDTYGLSVRWKIQW